MISIDELQKEIEILEDETPTYSTMDKLASLYIVRAYSSPLNDSIEDLGDSEFLLAVKGKKQSDVMQLMDELMDTIKILNNRLYDSVIDRLK